MKRVGILDLDLHYPNGTAAIVRPMSETVLALASLLAGHERARADRRSRRVARRWSSSPDPPASRSTSRRSPARSRSFGRAQRSSSSRWAMTSCVGDPHGCWGFSPPIFAHVGRMLAASRAPPLRRPGGRLLARCPCRVQRVVRRRPVGRVRRMSGLEPFRRRLDEHRRARSLRLLGERFEVCREVAAYKRSTTSR